MARSVGNIFKDSRNLTTCCLFCIYVQIKTQIHVFHMSSTSYSLLTFDFKETLRPRFITGITRGHICSDAEKVLLAFLVKFCSYGLQNLMELLNSKEIARELYENVLTQNKDFQVNSEKTKTIKNEFKARKISNYMITLEGLRNSMNEKMKPNNIPNKTVLSNWLSVIPMCEFNYVLNKQQFWDSIRLQYVWPIPSLPVSYSCGEGCNVQHAKSCKKGRSVTLRRKEVRVIAATFLSVVFIDVKLEPSLLALNGKEQTLRKTVKTSDEVRLDICARSFWVSGQKAFFDVKVSDPNA